MTRIQRLTSIVVLLAMVGAWCPPCVAAVQAASECCTQPCDTCACGFEAMPADVDPAAAVVVASPLTLDAIFETNHAIGTSGIAPRTSPSEFPHSPFPIPLSTSTRLSILSVYLI